MKPDTILAVLINRTWLALDRVGAISDDDAERLVALGVPATRVTVTGDTRFDQQAAASSAENALKQASLNKDKDEQLFKLQLQTELNVKLTVANWEQATNRFRTETEKLGIMKESHDAQLESQRVQVDKLKASTQEGPNHGTDGAGRTMARFRK